MDKETRKAHEGSISKWEGILAGEEEDDAGDNCPLCGLFDDDCKKANGEKCPIYQRTGYSNCFDSPYRAWVDHHRIRHNSTGTLIIKCPTCRQLADAEVMFLKSLLPKENSMNVKTVVFDNKDSGTVDIEDVSDILVYAYCFNTCNPRLLRKIDEKYRWLSMDDCTQDNSFERFIKIETLRNAIEEVHDTYPNAVIYQFNTINEFYKWAIKE